MANGPQTDRQTDETTDKCQQTKSYTCTCEQAELKKDRRTIGDETVHLNCEHRHTFREENVCVRWTHLLVIYLPRGTIFPNTQAIIIALWNTLLGVHFYGILEICNF